MKNYWFLTRRLMFRYLICIWK